MTDSRCHEGHLGKIAYSGLVSGKSWTRVPEDFSNIFILLDIFQITRADILRVEDEFFTFQQMPETSKILPTHTQDLANQKCSFWNAHVRQTNRSQNVEKQWNSLDTYHNSMRRAHKAKVRVKKCALCIRVLLKFDAGLGFMRAPRGCGTYLGRSIIKQISKRIRKSPGKKVAEKSQEIIVKGVS